MSDSVLLTVENRVATLTLNRPMALNALDFTMMEAMIVRVHELAQRKDVRAVILTGAGEHFMAGGDIKAFATTLSKTDTERKELFERAILKLHSTVELLNRLDAPVIAKVRGACAGYGMSMMAGCDLAIAADSAYFATAYRTIALTPDGGGTYFLPKLIGVRRAMEMFLLTPRVDAARAFEIGLINQVVPAAQLDETVEKVVANIVSGSRQSLANIKRLVYASESATLSEQLRAEAASFGACAGSADFAEGAMAFIEKRRPMFADPH